MAGYVGTKSYLQCALRYKQIKHLLGNSLNRLIEQEGKKSKISHELFQKHQTFSLLYMKSFNFQFQ